ncbi:glycosyltransferase family 4 protein [Chitinophaga sp.]|uniref:glycosyltransferase family 4 protein n=1 Tax=Chitinophaga sp. TaxID=1869181 RepID=UPI0031D68BD6
MNIHPLLNKRNLIFFGETPPRTIHGASISSGINLEMLQEDFHIEIVEEFADLKYHGRFSLNKTFVFLRAIKKLKAALSHRAYDCYYGVLYFSLFGIIKNYLALSLYRRANPAGKVYLHIHRSDFDRFNASKLNRFFFSKVQQMTDRFILLSAQQLDGFPAAADKKVVLFNTIEQEGGARVKTGQQEVLRCIYIANYIEEKGIGELTRVFCQLSAADYRLDCYGNVTQPAYWEVLKASVAGQEHIQLCQAITGNDKFSALSAADVFIFPSHNEGMPLVLLEAMSVGLPVITTRVGYVNELLGDNYPFYCEPKNEASLKDCIERFRSYADKDGLSEWLQQRYQAQFSRQSHKMKLKNIFSR